MGLDVSANTDYGEIAAVNQVINKLITEGGENFFLYLNRLNLSRESHLLTLSSDHYYYYDESEMKKVKTLINLRKLNCINHLDNFLHTVVTILSPNTNFIGCFSDDIALMENGVSYFKPSRLMNRFINFLDSRPDHILNRKEVTELLLARGFRIIDMTEMDDLTYFYSILSDNKFN